MTMQININKLTDKSTAYNVAGSSLGEKNDLPHINTFSTSTGNSSRNLTRGTNVWVIQLSSITAP